MRYNGSGAVNQNHKVFVALWDTPSFVKEGSQDAPAAITGQIRGEIRRKFGTGHSITILRMKPLIGHQDPSFSEIRVIQPRERSLPQ